MRFGLSSLPTLAGQSPTTAANKQPPSRRTSNNDLRADSERSTPEREHDAVTRVRNFEDVRFGEYLVKTWYYSPYPMPADAPAAEVKKGRKRKDPPTDVASGLKSSASHTSLANVLSQGVGQGGEGARGRLWVCDVSRGSKMTRS